MTEPGPKLGSMDVEPGAFVSFLPFSLRYGPAGSVRTRVQRKSWHLKECQSSTGDGLSQIPFVSGPSCVSPGGGAKLFLGFRVTEALS